MNESPVEGPESGRVNIDPPARHWLVGELHADGC
jgi:hypothetical protein